MDFRSTKPGPAQRETASRGIVWQIILFVVGCLLVFSVLWARPGLLPFSSQNIKETNNKVSASPAKVSIKATKDPEPSPPPPLKKSDSLSPSPSPIEKAETTKPSSDTTKSPTTTSPTKTETQTSSNDDDDDTPVETVDEDGEDDYSVNEEDYDYDYAEEEEGEDENEENNPLMSPNMAAAGVPVLAGRKEGTAAGVAGSVGVTEMIMNTNLTDPSLRATLLKLSKCRQYDCIKKAHYEIDGRTRFNFPHFFLIGWQKCATTSVNSHLKSHPQFLPSVTKESHWFTVCKSSRTNTNCRAPSLRKYLLYFLRIQDAALGGLEKATIDASVDYAWKGRSLSEEIHELFPWLKIVMMMREPISRMISYTRMFTIKNIRGKGCLPPRTIYGCLHKGLSRESAVYANALEAWLEAFPAEQIHVIQFEELQEDDQRVLKGLKEFLGMDTHLPVTEELRNVNSRRSGGGYDLTLEEYQSLIALVRPGAERVAKLLGDKGIKSETEWLGRWESVWNRVIEESCNADGQCEVNSNK